MFNILIFYSVALLFVKVSEFSLCVIICGKILLYNCTKEDLNFLILRK